MMKGVLALAFVSALGSAASGQTDKLYLTDGDSQRLKIVQGGTQLLDGPMTPANRQYPIAVAGDVRTVGLFGGEDGGQYDLAGTWTGTTYPSPGFYGYDGTTDGSRHNYQVVGFGSSVYSFDRDWQNPTYMFNSGVGDSVGITYDTSNGSLWIMGYSGAIENRALDGTLLSSFNIGGSEQFALAYEPSSDSLWMHQRYSGVLQNYSKAGGYIQTVSVPGLTGNILGMEFDLSVPAPGAMALLGLGGLAATRRHRA